MELWHSQMQEGWHIYWSFLLTTPSLTQVSEDEFVLSKAIRELCRLNIDFETEIELFPKGAIIQKSDEKS